MILASHAPAVMNPYFCHSLHRNCSNVWATAHGSRYLSSIPTTNNNVCNLKVK